MAIHDEVGGLFDEARAALDAGDWQATEAAASAGLIAARRCSGPERVDLETEGALLLADLCIEMRRDDEALAHLRRAERLAPGDPEAKFLLGRLHLLRWELDQAAEILADCEPPEPLAGVVLYHRAIVAELRGEQALADRLYGEAAAEDPDGCPLPVRMDDDEAMALLRAVIDRFPSDVRATLDNVGVDLVDVPDRAIDGEGATDPLLLGIYHGVPIGDKADVPIALPDGVRIFKRNVERLAADRDELIEQLRVTLLHEIGHHLGWDEDELADRGLA